MRNQGVDGKHVEMLNDALDKAGVTKKYLADKLNTAPSTISRMFAGELSVSSVAALVFEQHLGVSAKAVLHAQMVEMCDVFEPTNIYGRELTVAHALELQERFGIDAKALLERKIDEELRDAHQD